MLYKTNKEYIVTNSNSVSLRDGPDGRSEIIRHVPNDTALKLLDSLTDGHLIWGKFEYSGTTGWCVLEDLKTNVKNFKSVEPARKIKVVTPKYSSRRNKRKQEETYLDDLDELEDLLN